ncbi:TetR/AcrR family transcriptional regulator [Mycolicibacterium gadium]|jgi:AcrR family transcriptional regulator|uniref:TetR/AcrR family transcriptional regulator n=1 Tax=Mycolicibacterium gadium TaxID=1794 RepID=UPI002FDDF3FE
MSVSRLPGKSSSRRTQAERRAATRSALIEAAAQGISRYGYGNLVLEQVAGDAGYTRGALYHLFNGKEDLAMAVVEWVAATWEEQVWQPAADRGGPVDVLIALARGHIVFCRQDIPRVMMALRVEFAGRDHPVGKAVSEIGKDLVRRFGALITAGRSDGAIPDGPPARTLAAGLIAALEGLAIGVAGMRGDEVIAERMVRGVLGV